MAPSEPGFQGIDNAGRPTRLVPITQLVRLSVYWLGLSAIFTGLTAILTGRLQFAGMVPKGTEGTAYFVVGALLLVPVDARRREDAPAGTPAGVPIPEVVLPSG
jgi:hypothetical protein